MGKHSSSHCWKSTRSLERRQFAHYFATTVLTMLINVIVVFLTSSSSSRPPSGGGVRHSDQEFSLLERVWLLNLWLHNLGCPRVRLRLEEV